MSKSNLFIEKLIITDDTNQNFFKIDKRPIEKGIVDLLKFISDKDSQKTVNNILLKYKKERKNIFRFLDNDFKEMLGIEEEKK